MHQINMILHFCTLHTRTSMAYPRWLLALVVQIRFVEIAQRDCENNSTYMIIQRWYSSRWCQLIRGFGMLSLVLKIQTTLTFSIILHCSIVILHAKAPKCPFVVNNQHYNRGYYIANDIYPSWAIFVKILYPSDEKERKV